MLTRDFKIVPGVEAECKLAEDGEILVRAGFVFEGYYKVSRTEKRVCGSEVIFFIYIEPTSNGRGSRQRRMVAHWRCRYY